MKKRKGGEEKDKHFSMPGEGSSHSVPFPARGVQHLPYSVSLPDEERLKF